MLACGAGRTLDLHQADTACIALLWGMVLHRYCCVFLLGSPLAFATPVTDAVNERIPVSAGELEAHWQVDCRAAWDRLGEQLRRGLAGGQCDIAAGTRRDLELCAFIYQPPGGESRRNCPDFRGTLDRLDSVPGERCTAMAAVLAEGRACPPPPPED